MLEPSLWPANKPDIYVHFILQNLYRCNWWVIFQVDMSLIGVRCLWRILLSKMLHTMLWNQSKIGLTPCFPMNFLRSFVPRHRLAAANWAIDSHVSLNVVTYSIKCRDLQQEVLFGSTLYLKVLFCTSYLTRLWKTSRNLTFWWSWREAARRRRSKPRSIRIWKGPSCWTSISQQSTMSLAASELLT